MKDIIIQKQKDSSANFNHQSLFYCENLVRHSLLLLLTSLAGCVNHATEFAQSSIGADVKHEYHGIIKQYLRDEYLAQTQITIIYRSGKGTFISTGVPYFVDSLHVMQQESDTLRGILFPDNMSFDTAYGWAGNNLQKISFVIAGDSLNGVLPKDWNGFWYVFNTKR